jgi:SAM-dependent methyltransferase
MTVSLEPRFDLDRARQYWRHAPAGAGKLDTRRLADSSWDIDVWHRAWRSRLLNYPEEEQFLRSFAARVKHRRIVSVGSGLGFHEIFYASAGADVTCCDIVPSSLEVIARAAAVHAIPIGTFCRPDLTAQPLPGSADIAFVYGCLMHMPIDAQRALLARATEALRPGGSVVLMVYAWEFARRSCGWSDRSQFDPLVFARASDPTVGNEPCPWSDWHDDAKLLDLAGPGARIVRRQPWNDGQFLWYELQWTPRRRGPEPFFKPDALERGTELVRLPRCEFTAAAAQVSHGWRRTKVRMPASRGSYALVSSTIAAPAGGNALTVDLTLEAGAVSVALLDSSTQQFVGVAVRTTPGRQSVLLLADPLPDPFCAVISNHQSAAPAPGAFSLHAARVLRRPIARLAVGGAGRS